MKYLTSQDKEWYCVDSGHYRYEAHPSWEIHHNMPKRWDVVCWELPEGLETAGSAPTLKEAMRIASGLIDANAWRI